MCVYFSRDLETVAPDGKSETHGCFQIIHPLKNKQLLSFWHLFFLRRDFGNPVFCCSIKSSFSMSCLVDDSKVYELDSQESVKFLWSLVVKWLYCHSLATGWETSYQFL